MDQNPTSPGAAQPLPPMSKLVSCEVYKLSGLAPRLMKQLKIPVEELDLALGALVSASQRLPEGDKSFDVLVGGLQKVSPLLAKLGWTGQAGLVKYLAYINQLTADLGSTDAAAAAFEETIALMQSPRTVARFKAAFGKSFDIVGAVAAATKAGMDPLKAFLEFAEAAAKAGHPVLNTGELQKAMQTYQKGGAAMRAEQTKIKTEAGHIVDDVLTGKLNTAEMAMKRLTAAWKQFSIMFGKMLLSSGTLDYLDKVLLPAIQKVMEATAEVQKLTKETPEEKKREVENKAIDAYNPADDRRLGKTPLDQQGIDLPALLDRFGIQPEGTGPDFWKRAIGRNLSEWDIPREQPPAPLVDKEASEKVAKALELIGKAQEEAERDKPHEPPMEPLFKMPDLPPGRIPLPRPAPGLQNTGPMDLPWGKEFAEAGKSAGQAFSRALDEELTKAGETVSGWAAKLKAMLDFTAGPTVAVAPPGRHRGPGWLAKSRLRASHSDAIHVPGE
jgi:hypothetical protein